MQVCVVVDEIISCDALQLMVRVVNFLQGGSTIDILGFIGNCAIFLHQQSLG